MSQLRPLLSVVEQYRLDLQTMATLRLELLNLSVIMTSIQEEIGAYDYEELQQRVLLLETRLHSCMNKLGTSCITSHTVVKETFPNRNRCRLSNFSFQVPCKCFKGRPNYTNEEEFTCHNIY